MGKLVNYIKLYKFDIIRQYASFYHQSTDIAFKYYEVINSLD